jgi:hypothetical protein
VYPFAFLNTKYFNTQCLFLRSWIKESVCKCIVSNGRVRKHWIGKEDSYAK